MAPRTFPGINHLEMHIHSARHGCKVTITLHLFFGVGQPDAAIAVMVVDRILRILSQLPVEIDRVGFQPHHRLIHPEIRHLRSRVPGRSAGKLVPLNQNNIAPPFLR